VTIIASVFILIVGLSMVVNSTDIGTSSAKGFTRFGAPPSSRGRSKSLALGAIVTLSGLLMLVISIASSP